MPCYDTDYEIKHLDFGSRTLNILKRRHVDTIADVLGMDTALLTGLSKIEFLEKMSLYPKFKNILQQIVSVMRGYGFTEWADKVEKEIPGAAKK